MNACDVLICVNLVSVTFGRLCKFLKKRAGQRTYLDAAPSAHIAQDDPVLIHLELVPSRHNAIRVVHLQTAHAIGEGVTFDHSQ